MRHRTRRHTLLIMLIIIAAGVGVVGSRANSTPYTYFQFLADYPEPHQNVAYFNAEFIKEDERVYNIWHFDNSDLLRPDDVSWKYFTFKDGYRKTVGQPTIYKATIWVFGNSTIAGFELDDADTIPSQLQALVGSRYRVMNVGVPSETVQRMVQRMRQEPITSGDIVIIFGGHSEALTDAATYHKAVAQAKQYATAHGASFKAFLQPIRALGPDTPYLREMMIVQSPETTVQAERAGYPAFRGNDAVDLSALFANDASEMFYGMNHVNPAASVTIARAIYGAIWQTF